MAVTGANAQGVEAALVEVQEVSWAAGRTLRGKHLVLLAFAEVGRFSASSLWSSRQDGASHRKNTVFFSPPQRKHLHVDT